MAASVAGAGVRLDVFRQFQVGLILNTAVGGSWPGNPDATTAFPQHHDVDYVRVYQRERHFE